MPLELSFVIPLTVILAGIIAVFFWAQSGRKQAQIEEAARKQTAAAPAANAPARERKKWSANVQQDEDQDDAGGQQNVPLTKKQQIKMQRADEREAMLDAQKEKRDAEDLKWKEEKQKEKEEEEAEKARAAAEAAETARREKEELDKWIGTFSIEAGGTGDEALQEESQGQLAEFISHIQQQKVVQLDALADVFKLTPVEAAARVVALEQMGRITGVLDDRGKFICITPEEMQSVQKFITQRGRVSIADLAVESNRLIDLTPKELPVA